MTDPIQSTCERDALPIDWATTEALTGFAVELIRDYFSARRRGSDEDVSMHGYFPFRTFSKNATSFGENAPSLRRSAALIRSAARKSSAADRSSASGVRESIARV